MNTSEKKGRRSYREKKALKEKWGTILNRLGLKRLLN